MIRLPRALTLTVHRGGLPADEIEAVWQLMSRSVARERSEFEARLAGCDEVHLVHEREGGALVALLAVHLVPAEVDGRRATLFHAQWAFTAPRWRGRNVLVAAGTRLFLRLLASAPGRPIHLLYSAATIHSFLMIGRLAKTFWLAPQADLPPNVRALIDQGMRRIGGADWDAQAGLLRGRARWRYTEGVLRAETRSASPLVERYRALNPGQADGDALVCFAPMSLGNWAHAIARLLRQRRRRRAPAARRRRVSSPAAPPSSDPARAEPSPAATPVSVPRLGLPARAR